MDRTITFNALSKVKANKNMLSAFSTKECQSSYKNSNHKSSENEKIMFEYAGLLAVRAFTLADIEKSKFATFSKIANADLSYLFGQLADLFMTTGVEVKINPIIKLYQDLINENLAVYNYERDILESIDETNKTPESNTTIVDSIIKLLKDEIITKSNIFGI